MQNEVRSVDMLFTLCLLLVIKNTVRGSAVDHHEAEIKTLNGVKFMECCRKEGCPWVPKTKDQTNEKENTCKFKVRRPWFWSDYEVSCFCRKL